MLKTFSKERFTTKKAYFSLLLDRMSHTRVCLLRVELKNDVDLCLEQELKRLLVWDEKIKQQLLYEKIEKLKAIVPYINRTFNVGNLTECMK